MNDALWTLASVLAGAAWVWLMLHVARTGFDYMSAHGNPRMRGSLSMPRYTERTDALKRYIELIERNEYVHKIRQLGPVTAKAKRFDFGRNPR